jgi:hypothetical protein
MQNIINRLEEIILGLKSIRPIIGKNDDFMKIKKLTYELEEIKNELENEE